MTDATTTAIQEPGRKFRGARGLGDVRLAYMLILPAAILELFIHIIPMILGVYIAFLELDQRTLRDWLHAPFVGFANFARVLDPTSTIGSQFFITLGRTGLFVVLVLGFSWILAMAGAVFLHRKFRGQGALRTLFLVPYAIPTYVATIAWAFMLNQQDGIVNEFLVSAFGLDERPFWLIGDLSFISLVVVTIWSMWPFAFLMLMAALQNVPDDVYEAASLDGASTWRQFWSITLPMIRHANAALLLILGLWMFRQFEVPYVLFGPSSPEQAMLISPLIYQNSFQVWDFGAGAAMSTILLVALLIVSGFYIRLVFPKGKEAGGDA